MTASVIKSCVVFRKLRGQPRWQFMADLPEDRCKACPPPPPPHFLCRSGHMVHGLSYIVELGVEVQVRSVGLYSPQSVVKSHSSVLTGELTLLAQ